jgi:hypothetical protein
MIVAERNYGHDFALLAQLQERGIHFVLRLFNNQVLTPVQPDGPLSQEYRRAEGGRFFSRNLSRPCFGFMHPRRPRPSIVPGISGPP